MNMRILRGTLAGWVTYFLLGWLVYGKLLMDFFSANMNQCAARPEGDMVWWAMLLSNLTVSLFLTLFLNGSGAKSIPNAIKTGALFGLLMSLTMDLSSLSMTTIFNNTGVIIVDVIANTFLMAACGLVIVLLWGKEKQA